MRRIVHLLAGAVLLAACSGGDDTDEVATATSGEPEATSTSEPEERPETTSDTGADTTAAPTTAVETTAAPAATAPPTTAPPEPEPLLAGFDDLIELTTEPGAVPDRPVLSWTAVDGADHYGAYVYAPNGEIYWAWQGRETSVPLGGAIGDAPGPAVAEGMTWAVIAYDAGLLPIGVSVVAPLAG